mmetsp:Transcript_44336/g.100227  ORF Transcript_44336/g.100227 Transcript_44336/m.100227 type:complete len:488 (+) Transcript_44336:147-1610(+)
MSTVASPSSSGRSHFGAATRPHSHKTIGSDQVPLSDNSPWLESDDPKTASLFARKDAQQAKREAARRRHLAGLRVARHRELARRMAERETVENYVGLLPAHQPLEFGVNVADEKIAELRARATKADKFGAIVAVGKLEHYMRHHGMRVGDLFALVDLDCSGEVDRRELREAFKLMRMDLADEHFESLFKYLDTSGDGTITSDELAEAIRQHRRFQWAQGRVEAHEGLKKEANRRGVASAMALGSSDGRRSPAYGRLVTSRARPLTSDPGLAYNLSGGGRPDGTGGGRKDARGLAVQLATERDHMYGLVDGEGGGGGGGGAAKTSSLPMVGQRLMAESLPPEQRAAICAGIEQLGPRPRTAFEIQAAAAIKAAQSAQRRLKGQRSKDQAKRRDAIRGAFRAKVEARKDLESRSGYDKASRAPQGQQTRGPPTASTGHGGQEFASEWFASTGRFADLTGHRATQPLEPGEVTFHTSFRLQKSQEGPRSR